MNSNNKLNHSENQKNCRFLAREGNEENWSTLLKFILALRLAKANLKGMPWFKPRTQDKNKRM